MYLGYVALSVFFRVCTSVNLLRMRYVLRFRLHYETSPKKRRAREGEREEQRPLACTIQKKRRNKIRNLWLWLVCCSLLPTCNFHHRLFTYILCIEQNVFSSKKEEKKEKKEKKKKLKLFLYSKLQITQISMIIDQSHYCR